MRKIMKPRYCVYRRQGGVFYQFDRHTGKCESLETADEGARLCATTNYAANQSSSQWLLCRASINASR